MTAPATVPVASPGVIRDLHVGVDGAVVYLSCLVATGGQQSVWVRAQRPLHAGVGDIVVWAGEHPGGETHFTIPARVRSVLAQMVEIAAIAWRACTAQGARAVQRHLVQALQA